MVLLGPLLACLKDPHLGEWVPLPLAEFSQSELTVKGGWAGVKVTPASEVSDMGIRAGEARSRSQPRRVRCNGGRALHPLAEPPAGQD